MIFNTYSSLAINKKNADFIEVDLITDLKSKKFFLKKMK